MKFKYLFFLIAFLAAGVACAQEADEAADEDRYANLEKDKSGFQETWVNPGADFTHFSKIYLWEAEFQYRDVGPARRTSMTMMNTRKREFGISEPDRRKFEEIVSDVFVEELKRAKKFEIVDEIGPDTLILRGAILDIVSLVPPERIGRSEVYVANLGEATLVVELMDPRDGEPLAVVAERRRIQSGTGRIDAFSMPTNSATAFAEIRRWARASAKKLTKELDNAISGN